MLKYIINNNTMYCHHDGSAMSWLTSGEEDDDDVEVKLIYY
jgi:hypothetical protein